MKIKFFDKIIFIFAPIILFNLKFMNNLPLSWSIIESSQNSSVSINRWNLSWLAINILPFNSIFHIDRYSNKKENLIIRGCNSDLAEELENLGFSKIHFGIEAVLHTNGSHFEKKSLRALVKRGNKFGRVEKIEFNEETKNKFDSFKNISIHAMEPQLKNLFQTEFTKFHHLYVFISKNEEWEGAILASTNNRYKLHTELLLRKEDSPNGTMESLINYMFYDAKDNGFYQLSLGEVPFHFSEKISGNNLNNYIWKLGEFLTFAYNHNGLFDFKNKFNPEWKPLYICSTNNIGFRHFFLILLSSNFHSLLMYKSLYRLKNILK